MVVIWLMPSRWSARWNSLKSVVSSVAAGFSAELAEKTSLPSCSRFSPAMRASRSAMRRSRDVVVGDLNITVSLTMAAAISPASFSPGIRPCSWNMVATMVVVEPTGSLRMKTG